MSLNYTLQYSSCTFNRRGSESLHLRDEMAGLSFVIVDVFTDSPENTIQQILDSQPIC